MPQLDIYTFPTQILFFGFFLFFCFFIVCKFLLTIFFKIELLEQEEVYTVDTVFLVRTRAWVDPAHRTRAAGLVLFPLTHFLLGL